MGIKVSKANVPAPVEEAQAGSNEENTALAPLATGLAAFQAANLFQVTAPQQTSNLLPQIKVPCSVEMGDTFKPEHINRVGLFDGTSFQPIPVPYILTVLAARDASRKLITNEKGETSYVRAYKSMGPGFDGSQAIFEAHLTDPEAQRGITYIVGVIDAKGAVALAEMPTFKVQKDYWFKPLYQAKVVNGMGLKVKIEDHSCNIVASKNGKTRYLAPNKFTQHEIVELTPQMVQSLNAVWETNKDKFEAWTKQ